MNIDTHDLEELFQIVVEKLQIILGDPEVQHIGLMKIKSSVRDYVEVGELDANKIAKCIFQDWENDLI